MVGDDKAEQDDGGHRNKGLQRRRVEGSLQQQQTELRLTAQKCLCVQKLGEIDPKGSIATVVSHSQTKICFRYP